ncbi:MAG: AMP-binding protein [Planctomycetota bacterium]|nr:AMP-binding protein [Planctomycetota bacterium]
MTKAQTIGGLIARLAGQAEAHPFLAGRDGALTKAELRARVWRSVRALDEAGVGRRDRVVILLPRGIDEAVWLLAVMAAGAVAVPLHSRLRDDQVEHVLSDARPRLVVTSPGRTVGLRAAGAVLAGRDVLDASASPGAQEADPGERTAPEEAAVILYSSGSTGQAKGVVQRHAALVAGAETVAGFLSLGAEDHLLSLLSFSFDYGLNQLLSGLYIGCRVTIAEHVGVGELRGLLREHRPTGLACVPSFWHEVARSITRGQLEGADGESLRFLTNSGGALRPADSQVLRRHWPHVDIFAMYGLTEAFRSAYLPPSEFDAAPDSFGYAVPGVELLLVCPDSGAVLRGPATGELVHVGAFVAAGYWGLPDATSRRFRPDPRGGGRRAVYSGDLVRRDQDGRHYFVARMDRMMKVHGHRVSPDEVTRALEGIEGVGEAYVVAVDGGADGDRIGLFCAGDAADERLRALLMRRLRARLPSYMQPAELRVLAELPHNANGKVDEAALRGML